jgi:ribosomal protein S18 acetylase RimI-like enzyme
MTTTHARFVIRDARPEEHDSIRDMTLAAYAEYAGVMPEAFWQTYRRHLILTLDSDTPAERIVTERAGRIVGSVMLFPAATKAYGSAAVSLECPEVRLLAVPPEARGHGIGEALMRECAHRAKRAGASALGLHTADVMRAAVRLYERLGYVRTPELDFLPAKGPLVKGYRLDLRAMQLLEPAD